MKKLLLILFLISSCYTFSQTITIPDANFKARLIALGVDTNTDGEIQQSEALIPTALDLSNQNISDVTGIEFFTSLTTLRFNGNNIANIDVSSNTALTFLAVTGNPIASLNLFDNTALVSLFIADCTNLSSLTLPSSAPNFAGISGRGNPLTSLNLSPYPNITNISMTAGGLTSLDVSSNTALQFLTCTSNALTSLDLSSNVALQNLACADNNLTNLTIATNSSLSIVGCGENSLTSLDFSSATSLTSLSCTDNNLVSLNLKNGNNSNLSSMFATGNPNLICIQVDDAAAAATNANYTKDAATTYSDTNPCSPFINFPDANMKAAVIARGVDVNNDGEIQFNEATIPTSLVISNRNISDATGIEFFTSLTALYLGTNSLTSVDLSSNIALEILSVGSNNLTSIDVSANTQLQKLNLSRNNLSAIDVSTNTNLTELQVQENALTSLNVSSNTLLVLLECNKNNITSLDTSSNNVLRDLYCEENSLSSLIFSSTNTALDEISCFDNNLSSLDVSANTSIRSFSCELNNLTSLDVSNNTALIGLSCNDNDLMQLNVKNGNNSNMRLVATGNANLSCIQVDNVAVATANTRFSKDATASYSENCGPTITIVNAPASTSIPFTVDFSFDRDVTDFTVNDVVLSNATISNFSATSGPDQYTALITPTSICSIDVTIDVPANSVLDASNNPNSAATQVVVATADNVLPSILGKDITVQLDANGQVTITGSDIDNNSTDNCSITSYTASPSTFDCTNIGVNEVVLTVTDNSGNTNTATVAVTVEDTINPTVTAQNSTVQLAANNQVTITPNDVSTAFADNCSVVLSLSKTTFGCSDLGANTVTLTATDPSGNTATATATVTVEQDPNQALTATTKNITVQLDANGNITITPTDVDDGSGSGCSSTPTLSLDKTTFDCTNIGTNTVTLTATQGGTSDSATAIVTVEDNINPTAIGQNITVQLGGRGNDIAVIEATDINNNSTDNCGIATVTIDKTTFNCTEVGDNTVTLTVTDTSGNMSTATAIVTIEDNDAPKALAQNITVQLGANNQVTIAPADVDNGSSDNCGATLSLSQSTFDCSNLGSNTVTLTVTDPSGNTDTATATVTVEQDPNQALTAITKNITVQLDVNGSVTITPADVDDGSGSGCSSSPTLSLDTTTFSCNDIGTNTVTLTATQGGISDTATAVVTVEDSLAPAVVTQNITVTLDANGDASITTSDIDNGSSDNCALDGLSLDTTAFTCNDLGDNTVTLTVSDTNGNTATGTATVTVIEDVAPTVVTQDITVSLDANGEVSISAQDIDNGSGDSCSGIDTLSLDITSFSCPELGDKTVTLTVTDISGNSATGTATVTITSDDSDNDLIADVCDTKEIFVAKGFSPNGDNIRDTWIVENIADFPKSAIQVFNRWGEKVYQVSNYQNDWDGISNQGGGSKRLPVGPYLYIIELNEDNFMPVQGWVYINY